MWKEIKITYDGFYDAVAPLMAIDPTCRWVECVDKKLVFLGKKFQISYNNTIFIILKTTKG